MKSLYTSFVLALFCMCAFSAFASAQDAPKKESKRARSLLASPVNVNTAGAGSLPKGMALTMLNASFSDKTRSKKGGGTDVFSQSWLFKMRYGVTNHFEVATTVPYVNNERSGEYMGPRHIEGFTDPVVQVTVAPVQQHQGDPFSLSFTGGLLLPAGTQGANKLPGVGVWGGRAAAAVGAFVTPDIKLDTELVWSGPFERGNQHVKRGSQYQWNVNARYLFDWIDIGLESSWVKQESGDKSTEDGTFGLRNGYTEWFVGPSTNVAIDSLGMWAGVGVFFPVLQDVKGPSTVEDARFEFKIGKVW